MDTFQPTCATLAKDSFGHSWAELCTDYNSHFFKGAKRRQLHFLFIFMDVGKQIVYVGVTKYAEPKSYHIFDVTPLLYRYYGSFSLKSVQNIPCWLTQLDITSTNTFPSRNSLLKRHAHSSTGEYNSFSHCHHFYKQLRTINNSLKTSSGA